MYGTFTCLCLLIVNNIWVGSSVADPERFDADPDPTFQADADPDPAPDPDPNQNDKILLLG